MRSSRPRVIASTWRCASPMLALSERRLGDERTNTGLLRRLGERRQLLLDDRELLAGALEPLGDVGQAAFDGDSRHGPGSLKPFTTVGRRGPIPVATLLVLIAVAAVVLSGCGDDEPSAGSTTTSQTKRAGDRQTTVGRRRACGKPIPEHLDPNERAAPPAGPTRS